MNLTAVLTLMASAADDGDGDEDNEDERSICDGELSE